MFVVDELKNEKLAIKRMNCSCHVQIFNSRTRSCLDLLILMTEFGTCHRNESSVIGINVFLGVFLLIFCSVSLIQTCGPPQQGQRGRPGRNGRMGRQGVPGPEGAPGEIGDKGAKGEPGVAGSPGEEGNVGVKGVIGNDGLVGIRGQHVMMGR
ncbi:Threonyl-tRNA synthetase [Dirofilaria immitis]|nr:Threonyl-tRNA synthetase [Dirofilaria immitis]